MRTPGVIKCKNDPDGINTMPTAGTLPHCHEGSITPSWPAAAIKGPARELFTAGLSSGASSIPAGLKIGSAVGGGHVDRVRAAQLAGAYGLYSDKSAIQGIGLFANVDIKAGQLVIPIAIEAAARANGNVQVAIYDNAAIVNHCWMGNTVLQSVSTNLDVDNGFGSYHRFSLKAVQDIPRGTELTSDYRTAPWFLKQAPAHWAC